jgi:His-Xaa-Ser system protein HxsD
MSAVVNQNPVDQNGLSSGYVDFDTRLYSENVIFRVCHSFTARCFLAVTQLGDNQVRVNFTPRAGGETLESLTLEFGNELINQRVRAEVADETRNIRELIVAQAFAEADFRKSE